MVVEMKKIIWENSLSIALFSLFFVFLAGLAVAGHQHENQMLTEHQQPVVSFLEYISSPTFFEAVFENWESEFLQMGALVILTIWLVQKGAADSKKLRGKESFDASSRLSIIHASTWRKRGRAFGELLYDNSLSIALFSFFLASFVLHAFTGVGAANQEAALHGHEPMTVLQYATSSQFWFESFQNWQSEFLAVGMLIVLSIFLRQRHSPESKPIGVKNSHTGA